MSFVVDFVMWLNLPCQIGAGLLIGELLKKLWARLFG